MAYKYGKEVLDKMIGSQEEQLSHAAAVRQICDGVGINQHEGVSRLSELTRFLRGVVESKSPQVPSVWVDEAWHALLETEDVYVAYLDAQRLPYIHHVPGETTVDQYERTRMMMLAAGGSASAWPPRSGADCNGGCSGCTGDAGSGR